MRRVMLNTAELLRSAVSEHPKAVVGEITGTIPTWLKGSLYRNGPSLFEIGPDKYRHLFDGLSMIHKFEIDNGKVSYRSQFLKSDTFKKNQKAQRIVVSEFGTRAFPDPCKNLFWRYFSLFSPEPSDNTNVSLYPLGDELYCATETHLINRIDPMTLDRVEQLDLQKLVSVNMASAHPHRDADGMLHNLGMIFNNEGKGPAYAILQISPKKDEEGDHALGAKIVAKIPSRWKMNPSYYHSFFMTENYYIFLEMPLCVDVLGVMWRTWLLQPFDILKWHEGHPTLIHVIKKPKPGETQGQSVKTFSADGFFMFHQINAFEDQGHIVIDACCSKDGSFVSGNDVLLSERKRPDLPNTPFQPWRFALPIEKNEVELSYTTSSTKFEEKIGLWHVDWECLAPENFNFEFPMINYDQYNTKHYRYVYGTRQREFTGSMHSIIKLDVSTKEVKEYNPNLTENCWLPSEPVFVPSPNSQSEDDGVLVLSLVHVPGPGPSDESQQDTRGLEFAVLDAKTLGELARVKFPGVSIPMGFHGIFLSDWGIE